MTDNPNLPATTDAGKDAPVIVLAAIADQLTRLNRHLEASARRAAWRNMMRMCGYDQPRWTNRAVDLLLPSTS